MKTAFIALLGALAFSFSARADDFTVTIKDADVLAGITWAREQANAARSKDDQIATDAEYVQSVMTAALESYALQKAQADSAAQTTAAISALASKIQAARGK